MNGRSDHPRLVARRARAIAGTGLLLGVIAMAFAATPLLVPAVAVVLIGAIAPVWVRLSARWARTTRRLTADRVLENESLHATIEVRRGWLGLPGAEIRDPVSGTSRDISRRLAPLRGDRSVRVELTARFGRRGLHRLPPPVLVVRDPLELARLDMVIPGGDEEVLVLPAIEAVRWRPGDRGRRFAQSEGSAAADALAAVDFDGLRPYRPGTPASRIYWPAVARGAGWIERRLAPEGDARPLVVLDTRTSWEPEHVAAVDAAVRAAASLTVELARGGGCGLLLPGDQRPTLIDRELLSWPAAHARLAVIEGGSTAPAPRLSSASHAAPTIYVAAAPAQGLGARRGAGPLMLVVPDATLVQGHPPALPAGTAPVLWVSGCQGFALGAGPVAARADEGVPA
jgi:uncharacterized protein (DUF58 family)